MAELVTGYIRLGYTAGYVDLKIKSAKGLDDPEYVAMWPAIVNTYIDGSMDTQYKGFRRRIRIDAGVVADRADRIKILNWYLDNDRYIDYDTGTYSALTLKFVPQNPEGFESEWLENLSIGRRYIFELDECEIRTSWPDET